MTLMFSLIAVLIAGPARALPGHLAEIAGHGHWIGLAALGVAIAVAVLTGRKGRTDGSTDETEDDDEAQEA